MRKWTYKSLSSIARKYANRTEFKRAHWHGYEVATKNGWLDKLFPNARKVPLGKELKWTYETCKAESAKYSSRSKFRSGSRGAYNMSFKHGWLDDFFPKGTYNESSKDAGYWDYDNCFSEALKYKTRAAFCENSPSAYRSARRNKWLDDYYWIRNVVVIQGELRIDCVYRYLFPEYNAVYIGRTVDRLQRHMNHITNSKDAVYKFLHSINRQDATMEIVNDNLTLAEGVECEVLLIEHYKRLGYRVLNRNKGGSIGGISRRVLKEK